MEPQLATGFGQQLGWWAAVSLLIACRVWMEGMQRSSVHYGHLSSDPEKLGDMTLPFGGGAV
jgi:hypothetical protein